MNFAELQHVVDTFYPALLLEHVLSHTVRKRLIAFFGISALIVFIVMLLVQPLSMIIAHASIQFLATHLYSIRGLFLILLALWIIVELLDAMYYSYYFMSRAPMDFDVAQMIAKTQPDDITAGFLQSDLGMYTMLRLGANKKDIAHFLQHRDTKISDREYVIIEQDADPYITLAEYARSLVHFDIAFATFLKKRGIDANTFKATLEWVATAHRRAKEREAWWSRESLARVPSIGRNWAYGQTYYLEQFGHALTEDSAYQTIGTRAHLYQDTVARVSRTLVKDSGANVMLVADEAFTAMQVVAVLGKEIADGTVTPELEGKRVYVIDTTKLLDALKEKTDIESTLQTMFVQAAQAGNVILVVPMFAEFVASAQALKVDVLALFTEALASERLQVIAVTHTRGFHETVETQHDFMRQCERVLLPTIDTGAVLTLLEAEVHILEARHRLLFTMQSLQAIVTSAERYFTDGSIVDASLQLLHAVASARTTQKNLLVTPEDVYVVVESQTGIAQGSLSTEEQTTLQHLEEILHQRIVGQDIAITAISSALRRARAGLTNPKRPMGSFLFLGPTGVGKTETTKALAETFFHTADKMIRIDMSEYSGADALDKLIGSFTTGQPGVLSSKLREMQYGVLLLDEFEKASSDVHNVFLQLLDEGYVTDGRGEKIMARNCMIIATSNAGSDRVYEAIAQGKNTATTTESLIEHIIATGLFRPELINRFDGVIVFHPLDTNALRQVAKLLIVELNERLTIKGIKVAPTDALLDHLVLIGNDPTFGARAMRRAIQDEVERVIADGLIAGTISMGSTVQLVVRDGKLFLQ
jgi:ATP-dependent Clp protease ATP-binding subunit ClpC